MLAQLRLHVSFFLTVLCGAGCAPINQVSDFATAERAAAERQQSMLIFYSSWVTPASAQVKEALASADVRNQTNNNVICVLEESYEPNQRFVAQFGVSRSPALVIVHPDGSYHSKPNGPFTSAAISTFLEKTRAAGQTPQTNVQIPRSVDYRWEVQFDVALAKAKARKRPLFAFYKSVVNPESNEALLNVLSREDVAAHFVNSVNCRVDWGHPPNRAKMQEYGLNQVPAFLYIRPDGTYHVHRGRVSTPQLISFVKFAQNSPGTKLPAQR